MARRSSPADAAGDPSGGQAAAGQTAGGDPSGGHAAGGQAAAGDPLAGQAAGGWLPGVRSWVVSEIARHEIRVLIRTRTWRVATVLLIVGTAVGIGLLALVGDDDGTELNARGVGLMLTILTFVGLQVYGTIVVGGVVKEKADRVVEVLLAHVRARELLAGKVVGITAVATVQILAVVLTAAIVLTVGDSLDLPVSIWAIVPLALVIFVLGFGFYATLLAVAGSLVSRMEEGQFIALPVTLPLIGIYVVGLAVVLPNPDLAVSRLLSHIPASSPLIMPIRVAAGSVAAWEIALSIVLLLAATWWAVILAGRVYESTLLRTGTRTTWRDALRLARRDTPV